MGVPESLYDCPFQMIGERREHAWGTEETFFRLAQGETSRLRLQDGSAEIALSEAAADNPRFLFGATEAVREHPLNVAILTIGPRDVVFRISGSACFYMVLGVSGQETSLKEGDFISVSSDSAYSLPAGSTLVEVRSSRASRIPADAPDADATSTRTTGFQELPEKTDQLRCMVNTPDVDVWIAHYRRGCSFRNAEFGGTCGCVAVVLEGSGSASLLGTDVSFARGDVLFCPADTNPSLECGEQGPLKIMRITARPKKIRV